MLTCLNNLNGSFFFGERSTRPTSSSRQGDREVEYQIVGVELVHPGCGNGNIAKQHMVPPADVANKQRPVEVAHAGQVGGAELLIVMYFVQ
jgi:hypothetical protein